MEEGIQRTFLSVNSSHESLSSSTNRTTHPYSTPAYWYAEQSDWQTNGVMFDCEKLAAVRARRVPLVPSATHPSKANPVLVEEGAVLVVVVVVLVEDVVVVVVVGGTAALAEYSEIRLPPPQMSEAKDDRRSVVNIHSQNETRPDIFQSMACCNH